MSDILLWSPFLTKTNTSSPLSLHTVCWRCRGLNHRLNSSMSHMVLYKQRDFFFPLLSNLNPSGFYTFSLCLATTYCLSLVLPSLFLLSPLWLARSASCLCQASIKPISCEGCEPPRSYLLPCGLFKKRLKASWAELGAGCWVSTRAKHQSESTTDLYTRLPFCLSQNEYLPVCFYFQCFFFLCCCSLVKVFIYLLIVFPHSAAGSACWHFFVAAEDWNVLVCKFWR